MWKLATNTLLTRVALRRRGVLLSTLCTSSNVKEMREHMLFGCPYVQQVWLRLTRRDMLEVGQQSVDDWLSRSMMTNGSSRGAKQHEWNKNMIICWVIWKSRCKLVIEDTQPYVEHIV